MPPSFLKNIEKPLLSKEPRTEFVTNAVAQNTACSSVTLNLTLPSVFRVLRRRRNEPVVVLGTARGAKDLH